MSDQPLNDQQAPSDETLNQDSKPQRDPVPYERFAEVNRERTAFKKQLDELMRFKNEVERQQQERTEQEAIEKGNAEKLIDQWKPKAKRAEELEKFVTDILQLELADVGEEQMEYVNGVIDAIDRPEAKVLALRNLKAILRTAQPTAAKPTPPNTDAGAGVKREQGANFGLTPDEIKAAQSAKMTLEEYAAIKKKMNGE